MLLLLPHSLLAATEDLSATLSKGLFEEEANHNLGAAIEAYQSVIDRFDTDRKLAATAVFRLGECYRKQGNTNEANVQYQRILREFADQTPLVTLSRQNLTATGAVPAAQVAAPPPGSSGSGTEDLVASAGVEELKRVDAIIKDSPDLINAPDPSGLTLLQTYSAKGDLAVVKLLLDRGANANGTKQPDLTPLHYAAGNGHRAVVELLLSRGARADVKTGSGVTPLHIAALKGYELVAKILLDAGAPVNARVLRVASASGTANILGEGHSFLTYEFKAGQTALHIACWGGYHSLVDLLIAKGADVNTEQLPPNGVGPSASWFTPLSTAVQLNDESLVKTLLTAHADPNAGTWPALNVAATKSEIPILEILLSHGADPNPTNHQLPLVSAIAAKNPAAIKKLIQFKADPNAKDSTGWPIVFAALSDTATLQALLDGGADPNQRGPNGDSLLERVINEGDNWIELLLAHGADPNAKNPKDGFTALHRATWSGKTGTVELLLKKGANVDAQNGSGETPLLLAVRYRNKEVAALLLNHGADPNIRDNSGETPLDQDRMQSGRPRFGLPPPRAVVPVLPAPQAAQTQPIDIGALIEDLLLQHGALVDLPRMDRIEIRRPSANYSSDVFVHGTNDVNRITLLELIALHYGFVSAVPALLVQLPRYDTLSRTIQGSLTYPNLDKIAIRRAKQGGKEWTRIPVSVQAILDSGDCSRDVWLEWGDQVEIPETDHSVSVAWLGFPPATLTKLQNCLQRQARLTVKGQTTNLFLSIRVSKGTDDPDPIINYPPPQFCLLAVLQKSGLLRTSSDLARVKVTRHNSKTSENWEHVFDCTASHAPALWLRDGDVIDVPDKP